VELSFDLNTGDNELIAIFGLGLSTQKENGWETHILGDTAIMTIDLKNPDSNTVELFHYSTYFVIYGDWNFIIE